MVEITLPALAGQEVRYDDHTWELTGSVDVRGTGDHLLVEAEEVDDVRGRTGQLRFAIEDPPASLNPGSLGENLERLQYEDGQYRVLVTTGGRTYGYALRSIDYE